MPGMGLIAAPSSTYTEAALDLILAHAIEGVGHRNFSRHEAETLRPDPVVAVERQDLHERLSSLRNDEPSPLAARSINRDRWVLAS